MRSYFVGAVAFTGLAFASFSTAAFAAQITYTLTGSGASGTFNGTEFSGENFTATAVGDTANVASVTVFSLPALLLTSTTIQIGANPLATVTLNPYYVVNVGSLALDALAFGDFTGSDGIIAFLAAGGTAWNLTSSFGPVAAALVNNTEIATDRGLIDITSWTSATFAAVTTSATPEPGTMGMFVLGGCIGLVAVRYSRLTGRQDLKTPFGRP